jgi:hypothetical protein
MAKKKIRRPLPPAPPRRNVVYDQTFNLPGELGPVGAYVQGDDIHIRKGTRLDPVAAAHETGHLFDQQVLTDGDRHYITRLLHAQGPWRQGTGAQGGYSSPNEWFADYYAAAATGWQPPHVTKSGGVIGGGTESYTHIGPKRLKRLEAALQRIQARKGLQSYTGL